MRICFATSICRKYGWGRYVLSDSVTNGGVWRDDIALPERLLGGRLRPAGVVEKIKFGRGYANAEWWPSPGRGAKARREWRNCKVIKIAGREPNPPHASFNMVSAARIGATKIRHKCGKRATMFHGTC